MGRWGVIGVQRLGVVDDGQGSGIRMDGNGQRGT